VGAGREMTSDGKPFVAFNNSARCVQKAGLPKTQHSALDPLKHAISRRRDRLLSDATHVVDSRDQRCGIGERRRRTLPRDTCGYDRRSRREYRYAGGRKSPEGQQRPERWWC